MNKGAAKAMLSQAADSAQGMAGRAASGAHRMASSAAPRATAAATSAAREAHRISAAAAEAASAAAARAAEEAAAAARELAVDQLEAQFDRRMARAREGLADDADMPRAVGRWAQSLFDQLAPDVKLEFVELVESALGAARKAAPPPRAPAEPGGCCDCLGAARRCAAAARARVLYALYPYDKTLWAKLRSPLFAGLTLLK